MNKDLIDKIKNCEEDYISCFCNIIDNLKYKFYVDNKIKDMYDHNFMYIKDTVETAEIEDIIKKETKRCKHKEFCKIQLPYNMDKAPVSFDGTEGEMEHLGAYVYKGDNVCSWKSIDDCVFEKVKDDKHLNEFINNELKLDSETVGEDFCTRRSKRYWEVYRNNDNSCDLYLCFHKGKLVAECELFLHGDIAKIEAFVVNPDYQRRGIGTTLLKHLVSTAISNDAKIIYLIADEDDTPKEMYLKLGFEKVLDTYGVLWRNK